MVRLWSFKGRVCTRYREIYNVSNLLHIAVTPRELLPSTTNVPVSISQEECSYYKLMFGNGKFIKFIYTQFILSVNLLFQQICLQYHLIQYATCHIFTVYKKYCNFKIIKKKQQKLCSRVLTIIFYFMKFLVKNFNINLMII